MQDDKAYVLDTCTDKMISCSVMNIIRYLCVCAGAALLLAASPALLGADVALNTFPAVEAENLLKEAHALPMDFVQEWNVVLLSLERQHGKLMEEWSIYIDEYFVTQGQDSVYYNVALIDDLGTLLQNIINKGMYRAVDDDETRAHFFTLFVDREQFLSDYGITEEAEPFILLVARTGETRVLAQGTLDAESKALFTRNIAFCAQVPGC